MEDTLRGKNRIEIINIVFLATILLSLLGGFLPSSWFEGNPALRLIVSQGLLVLPTAVFLCYFKIPYRQEVQLHRMRISDLLLSVLFGLLIQPVLTLVNALSMVFAVNTTSSFVFELSEQVPFAAGVFLTAILPCVLEESVFRGVLYQEYARVDKRRAVILSGFLFGLMHGNLNQFCYAFVMGVIFALLIEATGSILSTMVLHFTINVGSVFSVYLLPKCYELIRTMVGLYENSGETQMAAAIRQMLEAMGGGMEITASEWIHTMLDESSIVSGMTIGAALSMYGMSALISGLLAFLVYRAIARRNGRWETVCAELGTRKEAGTEPGQETRLFTVPLMVAVALGVIMIFVYETLMRLPR